VRLSLLIRVPLKLDIALRTQKRLPFVSGAKIRMWAAPDEMHQPAAKLAVGLSSAPKARDCCLEDIGFTQYQQSKTGTVARRPVPTGQWGWGKGTVRFIYYCLPRLFGLCGSRLFGKLIFATE
jgi:hypothetical protein